MNKLFTILLAAPFALLGCKEEASAPTEAPPAEAPAEEAPPPAPEGN